MKPQPNTRPTDPNRAWMIRWYKAPPGPDGKRRQPYIYGATPEECLLNFAAAIGDQKAHRHVDDARAKFGDYLTRRLRWWESESDLKPSTLESYREAVNLYLKPALGHVRLCDLSRDDFRDLAAAMRVINTTAADRDRSDLLRRLLDARAQRDGKRISTRQLTDSRIKRVLAVASSALSELVPDVLKTNPAAKIRTGKQRKVRPLLWTDARVAKWRETGKVPSSVMVWGRDHCGAFLDSIETERLYSLFHLDAYYGLRRSELAGLDWADVDLKTRRVHIRQAQVDDELDSTKSEDSDRVITIDPATADVLRAWRKTQLEERLAWGAEYTDSGRVFTKESGVPLRPTWISQRFGTLVGRADLPPIRFHDLRHGAATMLIAAGAPVKVVSETLGHSTSAFTQDVYAVTASELAEAAATAIAAFIPRKGRSAE